MQELETALAQQAPPPVQEDPSLYELPPLVIDGIPTPVEKMTQAQLRAFIPLMLKYSTGELHFNGYQFPMLCPACFTIFFKFRPWQARLGEGIDEATLVAERLALGKC